MWQYQLNNKGTAYNSPQPNSNSCMKIKCRLIFSTLLLLIVYSGSAEPAMQNISGRETSSINGRWNILPDLTNQGLKKSWGQPQKHNYKRLVEVSFEYGQTLQVPGDWNSQYAEFTYFEDIMWYKRTFNYNKNERGENGKKRRYFLHFSAVSAHAIVFMNGVRLGEHTGNYTPFQFEVTDIIKEGENNTIVRVDNIRNENMVPGVNFDWWNYGGITRDVDIISTPNTYISDYWLRLEKGSTDRLLLDVELDGEDKANQTIVLTLGGTKITKKIKTDANGKGHIAFKADLELWSPESPKLYNIALTTEYEQVTDRIGFRSFETRGTEILLNGKPIFLRGVNMHEEIGADRRRSVGEEDAEYLVKNVLDLGCNHVRLTHYPADEHLLRKCEERGLMVWEEIPIRGGDINFTNKVAMAGAEVMMREMVARDKNRCGIVMWSLSNETHSHGENRNEFLRSLIDKCRALDDTRAITFASNQIKISMDGETTVKTLDDPLADYVDIIGVNNYQGWYMPWGGDAANTKWIIRDNKPVVMSEFGAGCVYGKSGSNTDPQSWSEEYMVTAYNNYLKSFQSIDNLRGTMPWVLFDFRSIRRSHATNQQGWNRKGLLSPEGDKKQAWYIMHDFYNKISSRQRGSVI